MCILLIDDLSIKSAERKGSMDTVAIDGMLVIAKGIFRADIGILIGKFSSRNCT